MFFYKIGKLEMSELVLEKGAVARLHVFLETIMVESC